MTCFHPNHESYSETRQTRRIHADNPFRMITVFTPSFADEENTNAQNLTVKEVAARLPQDRFRVVMFYHRTPDVRILARAHTKLLKWTSHANTARMVIHFLSQIPDVYFFPREGPFDAAVFWLRRRLRLKTAIVSYAVTGGLQNGIPTASLARNFEQADLVAANSTFLSQLMERHLGRKIPTIYDGVDRRYFYPATAPKTARPVVVLYAGSFRPYKRVDRVVRAAACFPEVQFRIAGRGEEEERCNQLTQQLNCKNIMFLDHLSQKALGDEMRQADLFLFPSDLEGHPQVLAQAAACGLPCVAMDSYHPEFVHHGVTGFLAHSEADLAEKLRLLIGDRNLRERMSAAAVRHMKAFDWDRIVHQWAELFETAVINRRGGRPE
jgi:glycosyltransferase involved in cell wall biosynthesis